MNVQPISFYTNFKNCQNKTQYFARNKQLQKDSFVCSKKEDSTTFGAKIPLGDFDDFCKWAKKSSFKEKILSILHDEGNMLGQGMEGKVFSISDNEKYAMKILHKFSDTDLLKALNNGFKKIEDPFENLNLGQPIAKIDGVSILKKQSGQSFGIPPQEVFIRTGTTPWNSPRTRKIFLQNLKDMASMPQEAYDKTLGEIKLMNSKGVHFDWANSNNLLLDKKMQTINIVDIKNNGILTKEAPVSILECLLNHSYYPTFLKNSDTFFEQKDCYNFRSVIYQKFEKALKNNGILFDKTGIKSLDLPTYSI